MNHAGESPLISPTHPLRGLARPPKADEGLPEPHQGDGPDPQLLTDALGLVSPGWRQALDEAARKAAEPGFEEELQAALEREIEKVRAAWEAAKAEAGKAAPAEGPRAGTAAPGKRDGGAQRRETAGQVHGGGPAVGEGKPGPLRSGGLPGSAGRRKILAERSGK